MLIEEADQNKSVRAVAAETMARVKPLAGRPHKGEEKLGDANISSGGTTSDYLAARIKRDRPDIAEAVERGARGTACSRNRSYRTGTGY